MDILATRFVYLNIAIIVHYIRSERRITPGEPLALKIRALLLFQRAFGFYFIFLLLCVLGMRFFVVGQDWLENALVESFTALFYFAVFLIFRRQSYHQEDHGENADERVNEQPTESTPSRGSWFSLTSRRRQREQEAAQPVISPNYHDRALKAPAIHAVQLPVPAYWYEPGAWPGIMLATKDESLLENQHTE